MTPRSFRIACEAIVIATAAWVFLALLVQNGVFS